MAKKKKLLLLDGNALVHRSFHAIPPLNGPHGEPVNAVYGFTATLLKAWKELQPSHIIATFDLPGGTFRDDLYAEYKAKRAKAPDELYEQMPLVKEVVDAFAIPIIEAPGFEADDMIGSLTKKFTKIEKIILTGDMDTLQLVDDETFIYTLRKGMSDTQIMNAESVVLRTGVRPDQIIDYKALRGDASDNIPGVKGIGEKTAAELLQKFETLDKLYQALEKNSSLAKEIKAGVREKLLLHKADAFMSRELATIKRNVEIDLALEAAAIHQYDRTKVVQLFQHFGFTSLVAKLPESVTPTPVQATFDLSQPVVIPKREGQKYHLVNDEQSLSGFLEQLSRQEYFVFDTETTGVDPWQAELLGISFSWKAGEAWYVVVTPERLEKLLPVFTDPNKKKIGHNLKYDVEILQQQGITVAGIYFDTMVASYLLNPGSRQHGLDASIFTEFGYEMMPIEALIGPKGKNQRSMKDVPLEQLSWYSGEDADFTWRLYEKLAPRLGEQSSAKVFHDIEMPLIRVLTDMELAGVKIDIEFLAEMSKRLKKELAVIEKKIYGFAGKEFNINSPAQLKEILFITLAIPTTGLGKTKTGISTAADELEKLKHAHPIIPLISQQREIAKLLSTYIDALPEMVNEKTGRVHTSFNQTVAATGRLASSNPNIQNIPIRTELGAEIRKAFTAERGYRLLSADYSQIELRISASMANDPAMIDAFNKGEDIHARTAASINGVEIDHVTPQMRRAAKAVNFGIIYGLGYVGLSQSEGIPRDEAKAFIEKYFSVYKNIKKWMDDTKVFAHEKGYVETLFGRRRYFPDINTSNGMLVAAAERQAINAPIQGTQADIIKLAMIKIHAELPTVSPKSRLLLQVHDELIIEAPHDEVEKVSKFLKTTMEGIYQLRVPIIAEVGIGKNWGEAK
jgi:DNA polymerase-1